MIFVEEINSEEVFKHWLDLDRQADRQKWWQWGKNRQGRDIGARECSRIEHILFSAATQNLEALVN